MTKIHYKAGFRYQSTEEVTIILPFACPEFEMLPWVKVCNVWGDLAGRQFLTVKAGYAWDGPSVPFLNRKGLRWIVRTLMRASLPHDAFYESIRRGFLDRSYRHPADKLFRDMCIEDGAWRWVANAAYKVIHTSGEPFADPAAKKKIYTAP